MRTDIKTVSTEMAALDKDLQQQFSVLSGKVDKALNDLKQIQTEVSSVSNRKMDKDALQLELLKARKNFQRDLDVTKAAIDKRIGTMLRKIKDLEKLAQVPAMSPKPSGSTVSQGAENITEQEIKE